eukprot:2254525-Rhodomonas_salina.1
MRPFGVIFTAPGLALWALRFRQKEEDRRIEGCLSPHAGRHTTGARDGTQKTDCEFVRQVVISLDGKRRDRPLKDEDFVGVAPYLPGALRSPPRDVRC